MPSINRFHLPGQPGRSVPARALVFRFILFVFIVSAGFRHVDELFAANVTGEWKLNEGSGTATADASGNALAGSLATGASWTIGKYGQGINLNGTTGYINFPDNNFFTLDPTQNYTWSAWVRNNSFREWSTVWSQTINTSNFFYFYTHSTSDADGGPVTNGVSVYWMNGSNKICLHSNNNVLTSGQWAYVSVTYNGTLAPANRFSIYVNGNDVTNRSDVAVSGTITTLNPTQIRAGANQPYGEYLSGSVDEIRYYRRLLTIAEMNSDMNADSPAPPPPDTQAPTVSLTAPANAANVSGTLNVTANAADNIGVAGVQFLLDGVALGTEDQTAPYAVSWNSTGATNGAHTLSARARDAAGNQTTSAVINVTVNNASQAPVVSITSPTAGNVSGTVTLAANATDDVGVTGVQFMINGSDYGAEDITAPYSVLWNTTSLSNGNFTISARARDANGNTTVSASVPVTVNNLGDTEQPNVSITAPTAGTVSGTINVTAAATDNVGVSGVQFLLDGVNLGAEDQASPFTISWNTTTATNGTHTLTARARDAAGNTRTSTAITVTVNNGVVTPGTLVAGYGMNENTGTTIADISGNSHTGTLTNGPTWAAGKYGQGVNLDGTNDYINIADHNNFTLDPAQSYTWSAWVRNTNFREWSTVWSQTLNTSNFFYFYAHTSSDNDGGPVTNGVSVYWWVNNGAAKLGAHSSNNVLTAGQWSHITVTYNATQPQNNRFSIYVNGNDVTVRTDVTSVGTLSAINPTNIRIGSNQAFGEYLTGAVDEVRFYRRLLTAAEVVTDMNTPINADNTAPVVSLSSPANNATVNGTAVSVSANATDNTSVAGVQFLLDGVNLGAEDVTAPYNVSWNTTTASNGTHTLTARARDGAGNTTTSTAINVTVNNVPDTEQPTVSLTSPAAGNVSGIVAVNATAADNVGVLGVQFLLNGNALGTEDIAAPYSYSWNTGTVTPGTYTLTARARDAAGNTRTSTGVTVTVQSGGAPVITGVNVTNISMNSVVVNWTTNTPTSSRVQFGNTTAYGFATLENETLATAHSQTLYSLTPGTVYQYKVASSDASGVLSESGNFSFTTTARPTPNGTLNTHSVYRDGTNSIIPWTPNPADGYITVMNLAWNYLLNTVPNDPSTGKPAYYSRSYINPNTQQMVNWPHNPAGLYAMMIESAVKYYNYSADTRVMKVAEDIALWHLDHGMTTATDNWPSVPYSSGDAGSLTYKGAVVGNSNGVGDGDGTLQPDKIGELGFGFLQLFKYNGNVRFRDAAIQCANVLASKVRTGNQTQSPWPYRVNARTGVVREDYGASIIAPISLLDGLIAAGLGNVASYQTARTTAWNWMMTYPMVNNNWSQYFEDVPIQSVYNANLNQYVAMQVALYLLEHPEMDPNWLTHVRGIVSWVESRFAQTSYGATVIREQLEFAYIMASHTARYASVNARLFEKTGDLAAKEKAYRSFNWATYMCRTNGVVIDGPDVNNQWFTDGYGDFIRHFMTGVAAVPEWTPFNENHILRSSSVIKTIAYGATSINYTTYDGTSTEVIHVNFTPTSVTANGVALPKRTDLNQPGWTLDVATKTLRIYHTGATQISINANQGRSAETGMEDLITMK